MALCHLLKANSDALQLSRCLCVELGCGCAGSGLFAARYAASVALTDGDAAALLLAERSAALNAAPAALSFLPLAWGSADLGAALPQLARRHESVLVLGADLLYYRAGVFDLVASIAALLALPLALGRAGAPQLARWGAARDPESWEMGM